jgi:hypothetical protein
LPPNFYVGIEREFRLDLRQLDGEVFLELSTANSFCR